MIIILPIKKKINMTKKIYSGVSITWTVTEQRQKQQFELREEVDMPRVFIPPETSHQGTD